MKIRIYTNDDSNEYAIACEGDQVMKAETVRGILYPHLQGEYEIDAQSDLAFIDEEIQEALDLRIDYILDGHTIVGYMLYAGDVEIGMISAMHNDCDEAEQSA